MPPARRATGAQAAAAADARDTRIWAAGAIYAVGQVNFMFDRSQQQHMTTMANKAALINRTLQPVRAGTISLPAAAPPLAWAAAGAVIARA